MIENIGNFIMANAYAIIVLVSIIFMIVAFQSNSVRFFWTDFWVTFPIRLPYLENIASLSQKEHPGSDGWMAAEEQLCTKYKPFFPRIISEESFEQNIEYMAATHDLGRTPTPFKVYLLLFVLLALESVGFSYMLSQTFEASERMTQIITFAVVVLIAILFAYYMHLAGHSFYRANVIRSHYKDKKIGASKEFDGKTYQLAKNQFDDKNESSYFRCVRRVSDKSRDKGSYVLFGIAVAIIVLGLTFTTWMRFEQDSSLETSTTAGLSQGTSSGNPFAKELPQMVTDPNNQAVQKAKDELQDHNKNKNVAAYLFFGLIFVLTQVVGIIFGHKYGFLGKETYYKNKETGAWVGAYANTKGYSGYEEYLASYDEKIDLVNRRLKTLQDKLRDLFPNLDTSLNKNFREFLKIQARSYVKKDVSNIDDTVNKSDMELEEVKETFKNLKSKEERSNFYFSLSEELQASMEQWVEEFMKSEEDSIKDRRKEMFK